MLTMVFIFLMIILFVFLHNYIYQQDIFVLIKVCLKPEQDLESYLHPLSKNNLKLFVIRIGSGLKTRKISKRFFFFFCVLLQWSKFSAIIL